MSAHVNSFWCECKACITRRNTPTLQNATLEAQLYARTFNTECYVLRSQGAYYVHTALSAQCSPQLIVAHVSSTGERVR